MTSQNRKIVLKSRPKFLAGPENFDIIQEKISNLNEGEVRVSSEMVALSAWQGMRAKDFKNFIRPFEIGELIDCDAYGTVVESKSKALPVGSKVVGRLGWQDYPITSPDEVNLVSSDFNGEEWLTALSSPGQTPYLAFSQKARPMPGETLVVSSAAGAIGIYTVQLGLLAGMRVVGIAGGGEKKNFVTKVLGAHACVDYKSDNFERDLRQACPDGIDLYFDLVGGKTADTVFKKLAKNSHVLLVGRVDANNSRQPEQDPANMRHVWSQEATIHSFSRYSYKHLFPLVNHKIGKLLREKQLEMHNVKLDGFGNTPYFLNQMLAGKHIGKVLVRYVDNHGDRI